MRTWRAVTLGLVAAIATMPSPAAACSCGRLEPCEEFWQADAVFTGGVTHVVVRPSTSKSPDGRIVVGGPTQIVTLVVDDKLRGTVGNVMTIEAGGSCAERFVAGESYFVYAYRSDTGTGFEVRGCSRTGRIADADADLAYAHARPNRSLGVVEGTLTRLRDDGSARTTPVVGAIVRVRGVTGAKTYASAPSDARGRYRLGLPTGTHALEVIAPHLVLGEPHSVTLADSAACVGADLDLMWLGRARGRVVDHLGHPVNQVEVVARSASGWTNAAFTTPDGRFDITNVPPRTSFVLEVSGSGPTVARPFPTTRFPGSGKSAVTLPASGLADQLDFALPAALAVHRSTGIVRDRRGPRANLHVTVTAEPGARESFVTDANGRFELRHLAGQLTFEVCVDRRGHETCSEVSKRIDGATALDIVLPD